MKLSGDDYILGAEARLASARLMYRESRFVEAIYLAGVAVECVLRAFAREENGEFDGRHDLNQLARAASLERFVGEKKRRDISAALGEVWARWKNNYRYIAAVRLEKELKRLQLDRGFKGGILKRNAQVALENAFLIVNKGTYQWHRRNSESETH